MNGPATVNARSTNLVRHLDTIGDNSEEERIPSLQVTDVDGAIGSVMYCGARSCCAL